MGNIDLIKGKKTSRWIKVILWGLAGLLLLLSVTYVSISIYIITHKEKVLTSVINKLNENLNGTLTIESMEPNLLQSFPSISIHLKNVVLRDSLWKEHQHSLLDAKDIFVSVNTLALLKGTVQIKKVEINNASLYLYVNKDGYSNTSLFETKKDSVKKEKSSSAEVKHIVLHNVLFTSENENRDKLFQFDAEKLNGKINYTSKGWDSDVQLTVLAKSLAFNTVHESFVKNKIIKGELSSHYNKKEGVIIVDPNKLKIGTDTFIIGGKFDVSKESSLFTLNISTDIIWENASNLLSDNISSKLNLFAIQKPIAVKCDIAGDFDAEGDPYIHVTAKIKDNVLSIPGGIIEKCSFSGEFTNEYIKGNGIEDANSAIKLFHFAGQYKQIPFTMDSTIINNLDQPVATGVLTSQFDIAKLNSIVAKDLLEFSKGSANVKLNYRADVKDFRLTKPMITGTVTIADANINYVPRHLNFKNTAIALNFTEDHLFINNIRLQSGKSIAYMEGTIENFLNLYYTDPEKIILNWKIHSPRLYLGEFIGFLGSRKTNRIAKKTSKSDATDHLNFLFEKSNVMMQLQVDKLYYNTFVATNIKMNATLSESGIIIKNSSLNYANGTVQLNGTLSQKGTTDRFTLNTTIKKVDIKTFFYSFKNFGLESLTSDNIEGNVSSKINIAGNITDQGKIVPKSINGIISFNMKEGALVNFEPIKTIGKLAFPFRNIKNITFSDLNGEFNIMGERVTIQPMKINSSVLNIDVAGVYSFSKGTNIAMDIPLRNPKKDEGITDPEEIEKRRNKGIVLHLIATDDTNNDRVKIKLNTKRRKEN